MLWLTLAIAWQAAAHFTHDPPRKSGASEGAIHVRGEAVRVEEPTPLGLTAIVKARGRTTLIFPERKQYLEVDPSQAALAAVPPTSLKGMKQVGEETVDGERCAIWEGTVETARAGRVHNRLWVPVGPAKKKIFYFLRWVTQTGRGATRADLSEIREAPQDAALFRVPRGFTKK